MSKFDANRGRRIFSRSVLICFASLICGGCGNLSSIFRTDSTASIDQTESVKMTMIDAKQRPISVTSAKGRVYVCPDKSPDALSQLVASVDGKVTLASGVGGGLDITSAEQVTSIAFRTQVTENQQIYLYFLCQLNANKTVSDDMVTSEMRHYQNALLGMLAIEELAGPAHAVAAAAPDPGSGAKVGDTTNNPATPNPSDSKVTAVQTDLSGATTAAKTLKTANTTLSSAETTLSGETNIANVSADTKKFTDALTAYSDKEKKYSTDVKQLASDVKLLPSVGAIPDAVTQAQTALDGEATTVASDQKNVTTAVQTLAATTNASGLQSAQASLKSTYSTFQNDDAKYSNSLTSLQQGAANWSKQTTSKPAGSNPTPKKAPGSTADGSVPAITPDVANAVINVVQTVVWQSFITEECLNALFHPIDGKPPLSEELRKYCMTHLREADAFRFAQLGLKISFDDKGNATVSDGPKVTIPAGPLNALSIIAK